MVIAEGGKFAPSHTQEHMMEEEAEELEHAQYEAQEEAEELEHAQYEAQEAEEELEHEAEAHTYSTDGTGQGAGQLEEDGAAWGSGEGTQGAAALEEAAAALEEGAAALEEQQTAHEAKRVHATSVTAIGVVVVVVAAAALGAVLVVAGVVLFGRRWHPNTTERIGTQDWIQYSGEKGGMPITPAARMELL
jgi:septal ring factor EnvC (AmiA/AmiB activator)